MLANLGSDVSQQFCVVLLEELRHLVVKELINILVIFSIGRLAEPDIQLFLQLGKEQLVSLDWLQTSNKQLSCIRNLFFALASKSGHNLDIILLELCPIFLADTTTTAFF